MLTDIPNGNLAAEGSAMILGRQMELFCPVMPRQESTRRVWSYMCNMFRHTCEISDVRTQHTQTGYFTTATGAFGHLACNEMLLFYVGLCAWQLSDNYSHRWARTRWKVHCTETKQGCYLRTASSPGCVGGHETQRSAMGSLNRLFALKVAPKLPR